MRPPRRRAWTPGPSGHRACRAGPCRPAGRGAAVAGSGHGSPRAPRKPAQAAASAEHVELNLPGRGGSSVGSAEDVVTAWLCGGHGPPAPGGRVRWDWRCGSHARPAWAGRRSRGSAASRASASNFQTHWKPGRSPGASPPRPAGGAGHALAALQRSRRHPVPPTAAACPRGVQGSPFQGAGQGPAWAHRAATSGTSLPGPHCAGGGRRPEKGPWGWGSQHDPAVHRLPLTGWPLPSRS